jgi:hypothetical protein
MFNTSSLHLCLICLKVVALVATLPINPAAPAKKAAPATVPELQPLVETAPAGVHFEMPVSL